MQNYSVRNRDGHLLCRLLQDNNHWYVQIKNRNCYTILGLHPDGKFIITEMNAEKRRKP